MKNLINFLSKIDEHNFIDLYFVASKPASDVIAFSSVIFHDQDDAQRHCDYLNHKYNTSIYYVASTCMHI